MTSMPSAGIVLLTMPYLVGFKRLGFDVYHIEEHGTMPWLLMNSDRRGAFTVAKNQNGAMLDRLDCKPAPLAAGG
jgi:hypothetical protein